MSASSDADTVRRGYDAFQRGDMDTLRSDFFAADIKWHQVGRHQLAGDFNGVDAVMGFFQQIFTLTDGTFRTQVHDVLATDDHVVVLATASGQHKGKSLANGNFCQVWHMRDGRAAECWVTPVDPYGNDEFWA